MGFEGLSSSVVIALAAVLWLAYLVPTWFRRREYLSTERNTVRLQQTLRILAETAEMPDQVRVENSARSVAEQEKVMHREMQRTRAIERGQQAAEARAAARKLAETQPAIAADVARSSLASRRLRRSRLISTLALLASIVGVAVGVAQATAGAGIVLLAASAIIAAGAIVLLGQLAAVARARAQLAAEVVHQTRVSTPVQDLWEQPAAPRARGAAWTPKPLPKPLYLSRPEAPAVPHVSFADAAARLARPAAVSSAAGPAAAAPDVAVAAPAASLPDVAAELRRASDRAEQDLRAAQQESTPRAEPVAAPAAPPSRFARMGVIDDAELAPTDINEALRRRRAV